MRTISAIVTIVAVAGVLVQYSCDNSTSSNFFEDSTRVLYEGKTYHIVKIGSQRWLNENLDIGRRMERTRNASDNRITEKYCYNDDTLNCFVYGGLYQWDEAMQYSTTEGSKGICPPGWHIPAYRELQALVLAVGSDGNSLKALGEGNGEGAGTNTSGFSGLLGGYRFSTGEYYNMGQWATIWLSTEWRLGDSLVPVAAQLERDNGEIGSPMSFRLCGCSVRCVKD